MPGLTLPTDFDTNLNSGNCWDEEDEVQEAARLAQRPRFQPIVFKLAPGLIKSEDGNGKLVVETLLIGMHGPGAQFLRCCLPTSAERIGAILLPEATLKKSTLGSSVSNNIAEIFLLQEQSPRNLAIVCDFAVPEDRTFDLVHSIFQRLQPQRVLVLEKILGSAFTEVSYSPLLRAIRSAAAKKVNDMPEAETLESPTFVAGAAAGVLSYAQAMELPCTLLLSLQEHEREVVDLDAIAGFEAVLPSLAAQIPGLSRAHLQQQYKQFLFPLLRARAAASDNVFS